MKTLNPMTHQRDIDPAFLSGWWREVTTSGRHRTVAYRVEGE